MSAISIVLSHIFLHFHRARLGGDPMKKLSIKLLGIVLISATLSSAVTPVFALGGCGPNRHRNGWGECVWGGQNQDWCLRRTGHPATRMPNGTLRCYRLGPPSLIDLRGVHRPRKSSASNFRGGEELPTPGG